MDDQVSAVLDLVYESAVSADRWPILLDKISGLFQSHFADRFSRTDDFSQYRGLAHGLTPHDYHDLFLDTWVKRNVWSQSAPARVAGEVLATRDMVTPAELKRAPIFNDFLDERALHEGLRLVVWGGDGWVSDISLLRSWSAGPFTAQEKALARLILPHIRRAFAIERRLRASDSSARAFEFVSQALFLLDRDGRVRRTNPAGETLLQDADPILLASGQLAAARPAEHDQLRQAVMRVADGAGASDHALLTRIDGRSSVTAILIPLREEADWIAMPEPMVLMLAYDTPNDPQRLAARYRFTEAESAVAAGLTAGLSLADVADRTGRSINTVRTHLSRLMSKTNTHRQAELVRCLVNVGPQIGPASRTTWPFPDPEEPRA